MEVEFEQLPLQFLYEGLAADEVFNDAVRERMAVQLKIPCAAITKDTLSIWAIEK